MSKGSYDHVAHTAASTSRAGMRREEVFTSRGLDPMLDLRQKPYRECLWVAPYEEARPVKIDLDETGSMSTIPHFLVTDAHYGLPGMVKGLYPFLRHPQIGICGIGDARQSHHELAPLQMGHFEGEGHKMDQWLTKIYLEGGGGGNLGESYELGFFVGARLVRADAFSHGLKGFHFTVADEPIFDDVRAMDVLRLTGIHLPEDIATKDILRELTANWHAFMIAPDPGRFHQVENNWRRYFGDNAIAAPRHEDIAVVICGLTGLAEGTLNDLDAFDKLMHEQFGRTDRAERGRVITTLEAYAATRGKAGPSRQVDPTARPDDRESGNSRL